MSERYERQPIDHEIAPEPKRTSTGRPTRDRLGGVSVCVPRIATSQISSRLTFAIRSWDIAISWMLCDRSRFQESISLGSGSRHTTRQDDLRRAHLCSRVREDVNAVSDTVNTGQVEGRDFCHAQILGDEIQKLPRGGERRLGLPVKDAKHSQRGLAFKRAEALDSDETHKHALSSSWRKARLPCTRLQHWDIARANDQNEGRQGSRAALTRRTHLENGADRVAQLVRDDGDQELLLSSMPRKEEGSQRQGISLCFGWSRPPEDRDALFLVGLLPLRLGLLEARALVRNLHLL
jgi:hypothetical protein